MSPASWRTELRFWQPRVDSELRRMRDAFFFLSVGGLAMSVAGLAGLVTAFRSNERAWTLVELWRLRNIARLSFICVFLALSPFPVLALTGDESLTIRIVSAAIVVHYVTDIVLSKRDTTHWTTRIWVGAALIPDGLFALLSLANVAVGSTGLLEIAVLLLLIHPVNLFLLTLRAFRPAA